MCFSDMVYLLAVTEITRSMRAMYVLTRHCNLTENDGHLLRRIMLDSSGLMESGKEFLINVFKDEGWDQLNISDLSSESSSGYFSELWQIHVKVSTRDS